MLKKQWVCALQLGLFTVQLKSANQVRINKLEDFQALQA